MRFAGKHLPGNKTAEGAAAAGGRVEIVYGKAIGACLLQKLNVALGKAYGAARSRTANRNVVDLVTFCGQSCAMLGHDRLIGLHRLLGGAPL